jgi:hypothetical protein
LSYFLRSIRLSNTGSQNIQSRNIPKNGRGSSTLRVIPFSDLIVSELFGFWLLDIGILRDSGLSARFHATM